MSDSFVVGLDTASNRFHLVANRLISKGRGEKRYHTIQSGPLDPKKDKQWGNADARRQRLYEDAEAAFGWFPDGAHIFCEEPLALTNGKTTRLLGLACGAIWAAAHAIDPVEGRPRFDLWWHWVDVSSWKKDIVGNGNASKDMIALHVQMQGRSYEEPDYYDADCLCVYGEQWLEQHGIETSAAAV